MQNCTVKDRTKEMIIVMQAYLDGEKIQGISADRFQTNPDGWVTFEIDEPLWNWVDCYYRIMPDNIKQESKNNEV